MIPPKLKNNQFVSDIIKYVSTDDKEINIIQELEPFNGVCFALVMSDGVITKCNKNVQLCNLISLILQSVFFLDYAELIGTGSASTSLNFDCPIFKINYNVSVRIDRIYSNNILDLVITYSFYDGPTTNDPYFILVGKSVSPSDILDNSVVMNSDGFIVPRYIIPIEINSITYNTNDQDMYQLDIDKCNFRLIRSVDKFIDNKVCLEIPASVSLSLDLDIGECTDIELVNAVNIFSSKSRLVTTTEYEIDSDGLQTSLYADSSMRINKHLFVLKLIYNNNNNNITVILNVIDSNEIVLSLSFEENLDDINHIFNGLSLSSPSINININCNEINNEKIIVDIFTPDYIKLKSQYGKFDYAIVNSLNNDVYIIKNINLQGSKTSFHTRNDSGLNPVDDYINISGDIQVNCAIVLPISYDYWYIDQYGKFNDSSIEQLLSYDWSNDGYNFIGIYDTNTDNLTIQLDCIT